MPEHEASVGQIVVGAAWHWVPSQLGWGGEDMRSGRAPRLACPVEEPAPSRNWGGADPPEEPLARFFAPDGRRTAPSQRFPVSHWGWVSAEGVGRYRSGVTGGGRCGLAGG